MDYSRPKLADRLAAEYVLGTLHGSARRRFEALLPAHPALRQAKVEWERRLMQLSSAAPVVHPSPEVWEAIQARLFVDKKATAGETAMGPVGWWRRLALWQNATAFAATAAISLGVLLFYPRPAQPPVVVLMSAQETSATGGIRPTSFVVSVSGDGRSLVLEPLKGDQTLAVNKALELWAVPVKGAPRSLGVVSHRQATTVIHASLLTDTAAFAVSVEPPGGSPSGAPTGPIISMGKLRL